MSVIDLHALPDITVVRSGDSTSAKGVVWLAQDVQTKAMWRALAARLSGSYGLHPVLIAFTAEDAADYAAAIPADVSITIVQMPDYYGHIVSGGDSSYSSEQLRKEIAAREAAHGISILRAMALSDRHLGRDLMTGAGGFARSKISARRSNRSIQEAALISFRFWEVLAERFPPKLVLAYAGGSGFAGRPLTCVLRNLNVPFRNMSFTRFGDRFYWADDEFAWSARFSDHFERTSPSTDEDVAKASAEIGPQVLTSADMVADLKKRQTWIGTFRTAAKITARHAYGHLKGYTKSRRGYYVLSAVAHVLRGRFHRGWLDRHSERSLARVDGRKIVYHALQVEPELTTTLFGEFASDQLNLVREMALSLPANAVLAVKEHPWQVGSRTLHFYKRILSLPNVVLVHPDYPSVDLIRRSSAVSTGSSSVSYEGAVLGIPSFHIQERSLLDVVPHSISMRRRRDVEQVRDFLLGDSEADRQARVRNGAKLYRALTSFGFAVGPEGLIRRKSAPSPVELDALIADLEASLPWNFPAGTKNEAA